MTTLCLSRHGESIWHAENRYAGHSDIPLTGVGEAQADHLGRWAAHQRLDLVASSDLSRCVRTAQPAAAAYGSPVLVDHRLREVDFGAADGLTRAEMATVFPDRLRSFLERPASSPLPGAERGEAAARRGIEALADLHDMCPDGGVLVVGHSTLFRLMLCWLLGVPLDHYRRVFPRLDNAAVTTLRTPRGWSDEARDRLAGGTGPAVAGLLGLNVPTRV